VSKPLKILLVVVGVVIFFLIFGRKLLGGLSGKGAAAPADGSRSSSRGWLSSFLTPAASGSGRAVGGLVERWLSPAGGTPIVPAGVSGPSTSTDVTINPPVVPAGDFSGVPVDILSPVPLDVGTVDVGPGQVMV
jgi:hypothetical protein